MRSRASLLFDASPAATAKARLNVLQNATRPQGISLRLNTFRRTTELSAWPVGWLAATAVTGSRKTNSGAGPQYSWEPTLTKFLARRPTPVLTTSSYVRYATREVIRNGFRRVTT
jgi:hypothetical protein